MCVFFVKKLSFPPSKKSTGQPSTFEKTKKHINPLDILEKKLHATVNLKSTAYFFRFLNVGWKNFLWNQEALSLEKAGGLGTSETVR